MPNAGNEIPEGERPGIASKRAPTTIRHPAQMGGTRATLHYITLPSLIELKIAAGRVQDQADVIALVRANPEKIESIRQHLCTIHADYVSEFERLVDRAQKQEDE